MAHKDRSQQKAMSKSRQKRIDHQTKRKNRSPMEYNRAHVLKQLGWVEELEDAGVGDQ